jgi:hypothetical protein
MNREQKLAWLFVIFSIIALVASLVCVYLLNIKYGMPKALKGLYLLGIAGLSGIIFLYLDSKDKTKIKADERDKQITKDADIAGLGAVYLLVIIVSFVPVGVAPKASIPTQWLPFLFGFAIFLQMLARSIAILVGYGRGGKENE